VRPRATTGRLGVAAVLGLAALVPWPAAAAGPMRVALGENLPAVEVGAAEAVNVTDVMARRRLFTLPGGQVIRVAPVRQALSIGGKPVATLAVRLEARRGPLRIGSRDYGGALELWRIGEGLTLINAVPLEEYVAGTVRAETSERWPAESLRAMAVVARTYAAFLQGRNAGKAFHLKASNQDQNYAGRVTEGPAWDAARATAGQVLTWQGTVFPAFYHSDSGGFTEAAQAIFSGEGIPPLPGIRDEFSMESPNYTWALSLPLATVAERLRQGGLNVGQITGLTVLERSPSFRVARLAVEHSKGSTTLRGVDFRRLVGYDVLKSTLFVPVIEKGAVRFEGRGWGHGAGLSQFGAKGMADRGYGYPQILSHYYPGAELSRLP
jgi:stage II sporulation protein D